MSRKGQSTRFSMRKQKSYLTAGVIALVAVIAMVGVYYKKTAEQKAEQQETVIMAENEWSDEETADGSESAVSGDGTGANGTNGNGVEGASDSGSVGNGTDENGDAGNGSNGNDADGMSGSDKENQSAKNSSDSVTNGNAGSGDSKDAADEDGSDTSGAGAGASQTTALLSAQEATADITGTTDASVETSASAVAAELEFSESDTLGWPISGNILMNYSMDQTVYFATLDQYKYNPALVIEGAVNDKVTASAAGTVLNVETTEETGETVSVDIGGGFQLIYGQLKDVQVSAGDSVEKGALIGFVSEPTKYYSVEGSNLYFEMLKDGEPVNPMDYLE